MKRWTLRLIRPTVRVRTPEARRRARIGFVVVGLAGLSAAIFFGLPGIVWTIKPPQNFRGVQFAQIFALSVALIGLAAAAWGFINAKRVRLADGLCRGCGYDLSGMSERCPECGAAA